MAGMMHVAVLLLLLADVVQLQVTETAGSGGVPRTVDDDILSQIIDDVDAKVDADIQNIMARKQPPVSAGGAGEFGAAAGGGSSAGGGSETIFAKGGPAEETGTSTMTAADFLAFFREAAGETREALRAGEKWQEAIQRLNVTGVEDKDGKFDFPVRLSESQFQMISQKFDHYCPPKCPGNDGYRSVTGECNNRKNPQWGAANRAFVRWLPAQYEDGVGQPQGWGQGKLHNGFPLPLPRHVSNAITRYKTKDEVLDNMYSQMLTVWGQWITHDMDFSPQGLSESGRTSCENKENNFPVLIPPNDPSSINSKFPCMQFVRTAPFSLDNSLTRQQLNGVTNFIDGSVVYGSEKCQSQTLRNTTSPLGLLNVNTRINDNGRAYLPYVNETEDFGLPGVSGAKPNPCPLRNPEKNVSCFVGGDRRVNQNLALIGMNTVFLREHNRLAKKLKHINPHWDYERIYQEARKMVGAQLQIINHRVYVPILLGDSTKNELPPYDGYNETENPSISNIFSLAFRPPHGTIAKNVYLVDSQYKVAKAILFHKTLFSTWIAVEDGFDRIFRGVLINEAKLITQDAMVSEVVRDRLFAPNDSAPGLDLAAFDMQRGRDHGHPRYNAWRKFCGLSQPRNLEELAAVLKNRMLAKKLLELYKTPYNIDLWVGAICEPFVKNGRVGPLLACLLGRQFRKIRDGDRYWWENPGVFSKEQRSALSTVSLSRILCDNTGLKEMPKNVFLANGPKDFVDCKTINELDLSAWAEDKKNGAPDEHSTRADL